MMLVLQSSAFSDGGEIPTRHTCKGEDVSPPLQWTGVPAETRSLVLIVDDPDAPDPQAPRMTWVHWVVYNLPAKCMGLPAGAHTATLPPGTCEGLNDARKTAYHGPCPPIGRHRYFYKLYALDTVLHVAAGATKEVVEEAMAGHIIAQGQLVGTYAAPNQ